MQCSQQFNSYNQYVLQNNKHHEHTTEFVEVNSTMGGEHVDYRKKINTDHSPEILFSDDYLPEIFIFLQGLFFG